ncbi:hypothetical protein M569_04052 [Genlisea aurea]|uniref:PHD-type domain-containing protein n=1 Tax=Genlisea aurea TaxID=192259 RepID=S8EDR2_9LAMI|nr:hypothetical protein M569_04052 [Genlisea aurea]
MVVTARPSKKLVKRRVTAELSDFFTFPTAYDFESVKPFRTNVREFLAKHATVSPPLSLFPRLVAWQVPLRVGHLVGEEGDPAVVLLDVVEEDVSRSQSPYCDQCRVVGWSGNPVSSKRYHFIIKADGDSISGSNKPCAGCGDSLHMADPRCRSCNHLMTAEDVEDWMHQELESATHLLHGVIHANGYGHLLRINGREGGSRVLPGRIIMNFWDRLCISLGARKVSVMDVSKKKGLEFRLLHAVIHGHPWYGEWGYKFGAGSFSLTDEDYEAAVACLSSAALASFRLNGRNLRTDLRDLISFYQSMADNQLVTVRDLFGFLMSMTQKSYDSLLLRDDSSSPRKKHKSRHSEEASFSRNVDDERRVNEALVKVLQAVSGSRWVGWRSLKGAVCRAGAPDLVNRCLLELHGKVAAPGSLVVSRASGSGGLEYRIESRTSSSDASSRSYVSEERLLCDLKYFYECMLHPDTAASSNPLAVAARKILDCKQFVKDYRPSDSKGNAAVGVLCEVDLTESGEVGCNPPPEQLILSPDATVGDLKREATRAFQDVYLMFRRFDAGEVVGYGGVDESTQLRLLLGPSGGYVRIRGRFAGKNSGLGRYRMERGVERWVVDCLCGAKDDDGERMLACDGCGTWLHTRCSGVPDSGGVPGEFLCRRCLNCGDPAAVVAGIL